jgi:hypothetical protein
MPHYWGTQNPMKMELDLFILVFGPFTWTQAGFSLVLRARS